MPTPIYSLKDLTILLNLSKANLTYLLSHNIIIHKKIPNLSGKQHKYQITPEEMNRVRNTLKAQRAQTGLPTNK